MILNRALAWLAIVHAAIVYGLGFASFILTWMVSKIGIEATRAVVCRV